MKRIATFQEWLNESKTVNVDVLKDAFKKFFGGIKYYIKEFMSFDRSGEPTQIAHLVTSPNGNNMSFNFDKATGSIFSCDIWGVNDIEPMCTLYANGASLDTLVQAAADKIQGNVKESEAEVTEKPYAKKAHTTPIRMPKDIKVDYKFQDPKTIFEDLKRYVRLVVKGINPSLLITGAKGVGKTTIVEQVLNDAGLHEDKDFISVTGKATAAGMYIEMYRNNGKLIIFDDCDSVFDNDDGLMLLKGALDSKKVRKISWTGGKALKVPDTGEVIPSHFEFTGKMIFISNRSMKSLGSALDAAKSRAYMIEVALSPPDMVNYVKSMIPKLLPDVKLPIKKAAFGIIKAIADEHEEVNLDLRTMIKAAGILEEVDDIKDAKRMILQQCVN